LYFFKQLDPFMFTCAESIWVVKSYCRRPINL